MAETCSVCPGSCQAASVRPRYCGDPTCDHVTLPLQPVPVVFKCTGSCGGRSQQPRVCGNNNSNNGCSSHGKPYHAYASVPPALQLPLLDPPEEARTYSSVFNGDAHGTGHARSRIASPQAWSAAVNDEHQWIVIDTNGVQDAVSGLCVAKRKNYHDQIVTQIKVDVAAVHDQWRPIHNTTNGGFVFDTNLLASRHDNDINNNNNDNGDAKTTMTILRFPTAVLARYIRIRPVEWQGHISMRCGILLRGPAEANLRATTLAPDEKPLVDVNQLPARVPVTYIPGGVYPPPAETMPAPRPLDVAHLPTAHHAWEGRRMTWYVRAFNGRAIDDGETRVFAVTPGQACSISVDYQTRWYFNRRDYCPGCIVQLYYDMAGVFCTGVVENGIGRRNGSSSTSFVAPLEPGLYYITQSITLQYQYHRDVNRHRNNPKDAFAAVRVLSTEYTAEVFDVLPRSLQDRVTEILDAWGKEGPNAGAISGLPRPAIDHIISYFISTED